MFALAGALADVCKSPAAERLSWRHLCDTLFVTSGKVLTSPQIWLPHNDWLWQIPHMPPHSSLLLQGPGPAVLSSATDTTVPGLRLLFPSAFRDKALQSCPKPRDTIVPACGHHSLRPEAPGGSRRLPEFRGHPEVPGCSLMHPVASAGAQHQEFAHAGSRLQNSPAVPGQWSDTPVQRRRFPCVVLLTYASCDSEPFVTLPLSSETALVCILFLVRIRA